MKDIRLRLVRENGIEIWESGIRIGFSNSYVL